MNTTLLTVSNNATGEVLFAQSFNNFSEAYEAYGAHVLAYGLTKVAEWSNAVEMDHTAKDEAHTVTLTVVEPATTEE